MEEWKNLTGVKLLWIKGATLSRFSTKQQQQQIEALTAENRNLSNDIKNLNTKIDTMEMEYKTAIDKLSEQINKIFNDFPHIKELLRWEGFLKSIGLPDDMVRRLFNKDMIVGSGKLYSKEHSKRGKVENASLKLEQDKAKPENIRFTINGTDIFDWFKQKQREFLNSIGINPKESREMKI